MISFQALALAVQTPGPHGIAGLPVLLWGAPGTAKSARVREVAATLSLPCEVVLASIREPSDFLGLPVQRNGHMDYVPPRWAERLSVAENAVLFLDEISCAPPACQAALLRVVLDRCVGDLQLPAGVRVVAAANPSDLGAGVGILGPALANRFIHLDWPVPEASAWSQWMIGSAAATGAVTRLTPEAWERAWSKARGLGAAFASRRGELLLRVPEDEEARGRAWPSPRSWEMGLRGYAAGAATHDEETGAALLTGAVGAAAAGEFLTWVTETDLPDPVGLLNGTIRWEPDPGRPDRTRAVALSVAACALQPDASKESVNAAWGLLGRIVDSKQVDLAINAIAALLPSVDKEIPKVAIPVLNAVEPVLRRIKGTGSV